MKGKTVYLGEWVKVRRLMSSRFNAAEPCSVCKGLDCGMVWYSINTGECRCTTCFDAEEEHWAAG